MKRRSPVYVLILLILIVVGYFLRQPATPKDIGTLDRDTRNLRLTKHARCRMDCRHIDISEVKEIIEKGQINPAKSEPAGKPDPKYAIEGVTHDGQEVRIVVATTGKGLLVITVIDLKEEWNCSCS